MRSMHAIKYACHNIELMGKQTIENMTWILALTIGLTTLYKAELCGMRTCSSALQAIPIGGRKEYWTSTCGKQPLAVKPLSSNVKATKRLADLALAHSSA